jgi:hypothetical protein
MADSVIKFRSGYKYQLVEDHKTKTDIKPKKDFNDHFVRLNTNGELTVKAGCAWDGTSGPVIDTDCNLRASLVHDAFYQLMRNRAIPAYKYKVRADTLFRRMCKEDGTPSIIAQIYYEALKKLGKPSTDPKRGEKIRHAP